jgi:hypothetical protein
VIVTLTVAVRPGLITMGEKVVAGLIALGSRSPVSEVMAVSNALCRCARP